MRVIDTSAWIEYLLDSPTAAKIAPELPARDECLVPTIVQFELAKWLMREASQDLREATLAETMKCHVVELDTAIALRAAELSREHGTFVRLRHHLRDKPGFGRGLAHLRRAFQEPPRCALFREGPPMSSAPRKILAPEKREDDLEASIRPLTLADFTGQEAARKNLKVFIEAAKARKDALDHVLFVGPPGLGKTTLAQIVARELGVNFRSTSGPCHRQGRRSGGAAHQSGRARRAVHRRNPSAQPVGRGNPLSGDGGFPARPDHRRGTGGALGEDRPGEVHPGRRHHPRRPADHAAARPLRHSRSA